MDELKLKKVNYLGEGYMHIMENEATGKQEYIPCTKAQYEKMKEVDGEQFNPVIEGYKWLSSAEGTIKTDSENGCLNPFEYCDNGDEVFITIRNKEGKVFQTSVSKEDIYGSRG